MIKVEDLTEEQRKELSEKSGGWLPFFILEDGHQYYLTKEEQEELWKKTL